MQTGPLLLVRQSAGFVCPDYTQPLLKQQTAAYSVPVSGNVAALLKQLPCSYTPPTSH